MLMFTKNSVFSTVDHISAFTSVFLNYEIYKMLALCYTFTSNVIYFVFDALCCGLHMVVTEELTKNLRCAICLPPT